MYKYIKPKIKQRKIKLDLFLKLPSIFEPELLNIQFDGEDHKYLSEWTKGGKSGCFLPGTRILMADGEYKEIQTVKPGDTIISFNLRNQKYTENKVAKLLIHPPIKGEYLLVNHKLLVTPNHPIWANNYGWKRAEDLMVGDILLTPSGKQITVKTMQIFAGENTVYHLKIENEHHNYFAEDILAIS